MNRQLVCILLLCLMTFGWRHALAAPRDFDVRYTVHNFSYNQDFIKNSERQYAAQSLNATTTQVCIFCHTPHNASPSVPLWNKGGYDSTLPSSYRLYTSSQSLSDTVRKHSALTATSPSLLCLSCHDGKTAVNVLHNTSFKDATDTYSGDAIINIGFGTNPGGGAGNSGTTFADIWNSTHGPYPSNLGAVRDSNGQISSFLNAAGGGDGTSNLTDDHPIGFSYDDALTDKPNDLNSVTVATTPDAYGMKIRFYGPKNTVECSSCHNPHVYYGYGRAGSVRTPISAGSTDAQKARTPFLVRDNTGSGLCLACHKK